ncbi:restriction endonuclease subunit S [Algoriphagus sp. H41]|uniref:Restriction endonuclease subunit S n=1 Tax=Algoriphagus oliviformis TaxID=2811231 RepID=A0ABS3C862_9BACT|nr:restriction endonuclease subunit S [Algoriphagus oliviformis]MBN7813015.1 restriction endonuclease subunit S [Algoriphagus oliviformis]
MMKWPFIPAEKLYSNVTDGTHDSPKAQSTGFPLVTSKNIKGGVLDLSTASLISKEDYESINKRSQVEKWDVIISMIGEYCGYTYIEKNDNIIYAIKNVGLFKTKSKIEANWLTYYLQSDYGRHYLGQAKSGSSQPYLSLGALRQLPILNPEQSEKEKIAKVLSDLDAKIELNNRINAELEAMAKLVYEYWFVQFDFPDPNGKPYKSSGGKMVWNEELKRKIPEGWEVKNIYQCSNVQYGYPFKTEYFNEKIGVPVIRIRDILENTISNFSIEPNVDPKYKIEMGDLLVGMDGNFHLNYWSNPGCYLNQRVVRFGETYLSSMYLRFAIEPFIKLREKSVSRTTVGHLSDKDIRSIFVLIPSKEVLEKSNSFFNSTLEKIIKNRVQNQELASLRDWLLPMLMNGQVRLDELSDLDVEELVEEKLGMVAEQRASYNTNQV